MWYKTKLYTCIENKNPLWKRCLKVKTCVVKTLVYIALGNFCIYLINIERGTICVLNERVW